MRRYAIASVRMAVVTMVVLGLAYPLLFTGFARVAFPGAADGSLVRRDGKVVGSSLIGQRFASAGYFHGRPSAAGPEGYDAEASGASNLAPTSRMLYDRVSTDVAAALRDDPGLARSGVPVDMVAASGSGLDPDVSPANALAQVPRVASARGIDRAVLTRLVEDNVTGRQLGVLGEQRVNVLALNMALDDFTGGGPSR